jgi:hypothetical protein
MIKATDVAGLTLLTDAQKLVITNQITRHAEMGYIRRWITAQEAIEINLVSDPDLVGRTDFWLTNISSDSIIESVLAFKNGLLLKSPYPNYGYPWLPLYTDGEFTIDIQSTEPFIPPMAINLKLLIPLVATDNITAIILYRAYIPGDYNFADAISDLYLKRTRADMYLDRDFHLFREIPSASPTLIPAGVPDQTITPVSIKVLPPIVVPAMPDAVADKPTV